MRSLIVLGLLVGTAHADVTVTFTTTPSGGNYAPRHVMAAWIETPGGQFIKTLGRWANIRIQHLVAWRAKAGTNDVDAISGATQDAHLQRQIKWNLRDRQGNVLPDGDYVIRLELADENSNTAGQNNQGTFTVTKGPSGTQTGLSSGGFVNVTISTNNATQSCGDGYEDVGETCDPGLADSCPTTCPPSTITCFQGVVAGNAAQCTAQCVQQQIMACANDDACCPEGCDASTDNDCEGGGGGGDDDPNGGVSGCATSSPAAGWLLALIGVLAFVRRRHGS